MSYDADYEILGFMKVRDRDDSYFAKHFNNLVRKYGGKWIVIAGGKKIGIGVKSRLPQLLEKAKKLSPKASPLVSPIPKESEIQCILPFRRK